MSLLATFAGMVATVNGKPCCDMGAAFRSGYGEDLAISHLSETCTALKSADVRLGPEAPKTDGNYFSPIDGASGTLNEPAAGEIHRLSRRNFDWEI